MQIYLQKRYFFASFARDQSEYVLRPFQFLVFLACFVILTACEDWRKDQQEENLFDPANAFIRFDYGNTVNGVAKDSILLKRTTLDTLQIPVALSSSAQQTEVSVRIEATALTGGMREGMDYELRVRNNTLAADRLLRIPAGQFVQYLIFAERTPAPAGRQRVRLELREVSPSSIHLGFPGSGRGKYIDLIYTE